MTRLTRRWHWGQVSAIAAATLAVALWDQVPPAPTRGEVRKIHQQVVSDGKVTSALEAKLPARAMIFELPVADYPEVPPIGAMQDYEHFRPYLQSRSLRFSYGSHNGRARENWQREAIELGTANLVRTLERSGFAAVLINKKAYADRAASLLTELRSAGRSEMLVDSEDFVSISLHPDSDPVLPPEFDQHWYGPEGNVTEQWRWSSGDAKIVLYNNKPHPKSLHLTFSISALGPRRVEVYAGAEKRRVASVDVTSSFTMVDFDISPEGDQTALLFQTDRPAELPGTGDTRKLSFRLSNFTVRE
jgi:phosphoglycerol transferase